MDFNKLSIATFNMHGFRNGVSMLIQLCNNNSNIIAIQEHCSALTNVIGIAPFMMIIIYMLFQLWMTYWLKAF